MKSLIPALLLGLSAVSAVSPAIAFTLPVASKSLIAGSPDIAETQLSPAEILELLDQYLGPIDLGQELAQLRSIPASDRTPAQTQRIAEIIEMQQRMQANFQQFLDSAEVQTVLQNLRSIEQLDPNDLISLSDNLRQLEQKAVLLYPLVMDDRLELVLVTADAPPIRRTVPVGRQELNRAIADFRGALQDPRRDATAPAQQLYEWLIAPIEDDLNQAQAEAILYTPDQQLRYIPLAALHDGEGWLVERYSINNITAASLTDFDRPRPQQPRILAAAAAEGVADLRVGDRDYSFMSIPYAQTEVEAIAALMPNTTVLLNQDFTLSALTAQMNDYDIVHLATNGVFVPGDPDDSFILLGNGEALTLPEIAGWNLSNVDLMVLSGCDTAIGGELGNGEEILGFGYLMQRAGAKAVLSSLWTISDQGTALLMEAFYRRLSQGDVYAIALRQAQLALIQGDLVSLQTKGSASIEAVLTGDRPADFSHPYYWAAFVLVGDGL